MAKEDVLRREFNSKTFRDRLKSELGCECVNCGSTENIQYHHIVPLCNGGTNRISNIAPLCYSCHKASHGKHSVETYAVPEVKEAKCTGTVVVNTEEVHKDSECYVNAKPFLDKYFSGEIGTEECITEMGYSTKNIKSLSVTKEYMRKHGITCFKNNVDRLRSKGRLAKGVVVGYVHKDGKRMELIY